MVLFVLKGTAGSATFPRSSSIKRYVNCSHRSRGFSIVCLAGSADAFIGDVKGWEQKQGQAEKLEDGKGSEMDELKKKIKYLEER